MSDLDFKKIELKRSLVEYFNKKNLKYNDIAKMLGCTDAYVSNLINGRRNFGKKSAKIWNQKFGFSEIYLTNGIGSLFGNGNNNNHVTIQNTIAGNNSIKKDENRTDDNIMLELVKTQRELIALQKENIQLAEEVRELSKELDEIRQKKERN